MNRYVTDYREYYLATDSACSKTTPELQTQESCQSPELVLCRPPSLISKPSYLSSQRIAFSKTRASQKNSWKRNKWHKNLRSTDKKHIQSQLGHQKLQCALQGRHFYLLLPEELRQSCQGGCPPQPKLLRFWVAGAPFTSLSFQRKCGPRGICSVCFAKDIITLCAQHSRVEGSSKLLCMASFFSPSWLKNLYKLYFG